ncbi:M56 family metallopeptidase [Olivibacter domesticus]|uniref:TonB protein C-terminal n=1 Tax=Olivibacter domesticus TaxID=407022 RepID=A0A1H7RX74_OLID1|nr:M56 family metallopeptidase [Olivibacter domesticus]SEL64921.1 TonB protein C-terminal [Olivibacter domesticus]
MMNYLVIANIYLVLFYGFYRFFLSKETFFQLNRIYLIGTTGLSFVLPLIQLEWLQNAFGASTVYAARSSLDAVTLEIVPNVDVVGTDNGFQLPVWFYLYIGGVLVQLILLLRKFIYLRNWLRTNHEGDAYSFMRTIKVDGAQEESAKVIDHEQVHVRQLHSFDVLLVEMVKLFNWFNPIVYCLSNSLKLTHEYIADEAINKSHMEKVAYAELLISRTFSVSSNVLTNNFLNQSFIKNRIMMLFKDKSKRPALLKYVLAMPLFIGMLLFSSAKVSDKAERLTELALGQAEATNFYKLVGTHVRYLGDAKINEVQGAVDIAFEKGTNNLETKVLNTIGYDQEAEVIRVLQLPEVVKEMPDGKHVLRVKFLLAGTAKEKLNASPLVVPTGYQPLEEVVVVGYNPSSQEKENDIPSPKVVQVKSTKADKETLPPQVVLVRTDTTKNVQDFNKVDVQPRFPGGMHAFYKWVGENYKYPAEAKKNEVSGSLHLSFIVERDGTLSSFKILRDLGYGTGEEAVNLLKKSPKWTPGSIKGEVVRVSYSLPIKLNLAGIKDTTKTKTTP